MCPRFPHHPGVPHGHVPLLEPVIDENTPQPVRVFHALRAVLHLQKQLLMRKLAEKDAHLGQAFSLLMLAKCEGISQGDLAEMLNVARPTVTIMLKKMEKAGLIERRSDERDQRFVRIYLTPAGRARNETLEAVHTEVIGATIGRMSDEDQRELERLLRMLEENLSAAE